MSGRMQSFRVQEPGPLLDVLARELGNRTRAKKWLRLGRVSVNGVAAGRHDVALATGDLVRIEATASTTLPGRIPGLDLMYEDDALLVVDKPAGLLTIATDVEKSRTAYHKVNEYLQYRYRPKAVRALIVHRLDRETSGLLVFAKTLEVKQRLQDTWDEVEKRYFAVVEGTPPQASGIIETQLTESAALNVFSGRKTARSRHAITEYTVLKSSETRSLLDVRTRTGRKHQIRVHLADLGHAIVGDDRYGKGRPTGRLCLHASLLRFPHPATGETIEFRSELPVPMTRTLTGSRAKSR